MILIDVTAGHRDQHLLCYFRQSNEQMVKSSNSSSTSVSNTPLSPVKTTFSGQTCVSSIKPGPLPSNLDDLKVSTSFGLCCPKGLCCSAVPEAELGTVEAPWHEHTQEDIRPELVTKAVTGSLALLLCRWPVCALLQSMEPELWLEGAAGQASSSGVKGLLCFCFCSCGSTPLVVDIRDAASKPGSVTSTQPLSGHCGQASSALCTSRYLLGAAAVGTALNSSSVSHGAKAGRAEGTTTDSNSPSMLCS